MLIFQITKIFQFSFPRSGSLNKALPMGHSYVCLDTKDLPHIMQNILTSAIMAS